MAEPEPFCDVMQLPVSGCAHCRAKPRRQRPVTAAQPDWQGMADLVDEAAGEVGPLIRALYAGRCPGCGGWIKVDDFIAYSGDEQRYVCADCARGTV